MSQSSSQNDATDFVRNVNFTQGSSAPPPETVTASDLLLGAYDPTRLHPMSGLTDKLDYLMLDDDKVSDLPGSGTAIPSRGWSDDLCYGTGTMYLSGMSIYTCLSFLFSYHTSYCSPAHHMFASFPQVSVSVVSGACVKVLADLLPFQIVACASIASSTLSRGEALLSVIPQVF